MEISLLSIIFFPLSVHLILQWELMPTISRYLILWYDCWILYTRNLLLNVWQADPRAMCSCTSSYFLLLVLVVDRVVEPDEDEGNSDIGYGDVPMLYGIPPILINLAMLSRAVIWRIRSCSCWDCLFIYCWDCLFIYFWDCLFICCWDCLFTYCWDCLFIYCWDCLFTYCWDCLFTYC